MSGTGINSEPRKNNPRKHKPSPRKQSQIVPRPGRRNWEFAEPSQDWTSFYSWFGSRSLCYKGEELKAKRAEKKRKRFAKRKS